MSLRAGHLLAAAAVIVLAYAGGYLPFRAARVFNADRSGTEYRPVIRVDPAHGRLAYLGFQPAFWIDHRITGVALFLDDGHSQGYEIPGE